MSFQFVVPFGISFVRETWVISSNVSVLVGSLALLLVKAAIDPVLVILHRELV
jgi:hypothetical protein